MSPLNLSTKQHWLKIVLLTLFLLLQACASAQLKIEVDMYDEDPRFTPSMDIEEAHQLLLSSKKLYASGVAEAKTSSALARKSATVFKDAWHSVAPSDEQPQKVIEEIDRELNRYLRSIRETKEPATNLVSTKCYEEHEIDSAKAHKMTSVLNQETQTAQYCEPVVTSTEIPDEESQQNPCDYEASDLSPGSKPSNLDQLKRLNTAVEQAVSCYVIEYANKYKTEYKKNKKEKSAVDPEIADKNARLPCLPYEFQPFGSRKPGTMPHPKACQKGSGGNPVKSSDHQEVLRKLSRNKDLREKETAVLSAVNDLVSGYRNLRASNSSFHINWSLLGHAFNSKLAYLDPQKDEKTIRYLRSIAESVQNDMYALAEETAQSTGQESAQARKLSLADSPNTLMQSSIAVGQEVEALRSNLPASASAMSALSELVKSSSRYYELIDRLQDAGDPVWRIITDPRNELHWNKRMGKTYFYAEGNSAVVVVRDTPMHYRVHHGNNNPTALIKSQLEISRAVSKAALSVAGAASGLPTGSLASQENPQRSDGSVTTDNSLVSRRANAEENTAIRTRAVNNLSRNLTLIRDQLASIEGDKEEDLDPIKQQLTAILAGHKPLFKSEVD